MKDRPRTMTPLRMLLTTATLSGALLMTGCEMVDSQMLAQMREYFPLAEIAHPRPDVLVINTHLANLTEKFAEETVAAMLQRYCCHGGSPLNGAINQDLDVVLPLAGYSRLAVAFNEAGCIWQPAERTTFYCQPLPSRGPWHAYSIYTQTNSPAVIQQAPQLPPFNPSIRPLTKR